MTELLDDIGRLTPEERELLLLRLQKMGRKAGAAPPQAERITPRGRETDTFPLSFAQEKLWFLDRLRPEAAVNNIPIGVRLEGRLDVAAFARALSGLVARHEALRTGFPDFGGRPVQVVAPAMEVPLPVTDLSDLGAAAAERVWRLAESEARRPFDLRRPPLLRPLLLRLGERSHVLLLTIHHLVFDQWSLGSFMRKLGELYAAGLAGRPARLPALALHYADYASWQREYLTGEVLDSQLGFWKGHLAGCRFALDLPTDRERPAEPSGRGASHDFQVDAALREALNRLSTAEGATLFMTLLATYDALLHLCSRQDDVVVGLSMTNRARANLAEPIGYFTNHLAVRADLSGDPTFRQLLGRVREVTLAAFSHQDLPMDRLLDELRPEHGEKLRLFQAMFRLHNTRMPSIALPGLDITVLDVSAKRAHVDLDLSLEETPDGLKGWVMYPVELFDAATVAEMAGTYVEILRRVVAEPDVRLSELPLTPELARRLAAARARQARQRIAVAATFVAEPLEESLSFWMDELDVLADLEFAPYNQVFQQLLNPESLLARNDSGLNALLLRFEDWQHYRAGDEAGWEAAAGGMERDVRDLAAALAAAARRSPVPWLVVVCPESPASPAAARELFTRLESLLAAGLAGASSVHLVTPAEIARLFPVADFYDRTADQIAHVPYTPLFYTALGSLVARKVHALKSLPAKVLVLDCDQTLWRGTCGEDGPDGVELTPARLALQRFAVAQQEAGALLCLCSKNQEADVLAVFERRAEMPLRLEHLVARRIDWQPKSEGLAALARGLGLGLDSFVLLDDNPVECAEVRAHRPEVVVLQLPEREEEIVPFLTHCWAFDRLTVTEEDRRRSALYRQNLERERFRQEAPTFESFLGGLEMRVEIAPPAPADFARASQLTVRTNQFNATLARRSAAELEALCRDGRHRALTVRVSDRFGDYGMVGLLLFAATPEAAGALEVDTFLMSCRSLGRGVEHRMLARLGEVALEADLAEVRIPFVPAERNEPMRRFLESVAADFRTAPGDGRTLYRLPSAVAAAVRPQISVAAATDEAPATPALSVSPIGGAGRSELLQRIATSLREPEQVLRAINARRQRQRADTADEPFAPPATPIEEEVAEIWCDVLGLDRVGRNDSFFRIGGHSLLGTVLLSRIQLAFDVELPLIALFESPTVAGFARAIERELIGTLEAGELDAALSEVKEMAGP